MTTIKINPVEVISSGGQAASAKQKVASAKDGIRDINAQLDNSIKTRNNIGERLSSLTRTLEDIEGKITKIKRVSDDSTVNYERTDDRAESDAHAITR
jgi:chromosome segregation ATPase